MSKYKQANPAKYFLAKYFFLGLSMIQALIAVVILVKMESTLKNQYASLLFFTLGALFFVAFLIIKEKVRRVAVGKKKLIIINSSKKQKVEWSDVNSLEIIPFINMYRLRLKGKKKGIYFFPTRNIDPAYGLLGEDNSKMGDLLKKLNAG